MIDSFLKICFTNDMKIIIFSHKDLINYPFDGFVLFVTSETHLNNWNVGEETEYDFDSLEQVMQHLKFGSKTVCLKKLLN